jgi:hypothetical protein
MTATTLIQSSQKIRRNEMPEQSNAQNREEGLGLQKKFKLRRGTGCGTEVA